MARGLVQFALAASLGLVLPVVPLASEVAHAVTTTRVVGVATVEELYAAVNDPANAGAVIDLAPGSYVLDPSRPNGGTLVLQPGMALVGHNEYVDRDGDGVWDPLGSDPEIFADPATETVIDGGRLGENEPSGGVIRTGRDNSVEKLTLKGNPEAPAVIKVIPERAAGGIAAKVTDCIIGGARRGIQVFHGGPDFSGFRSSVTIEGNIIRHNRAGFGFGIHIQQAFVAGAAWKAQLRNNRFYDNRVGLFVETASSQTSEITVLSTANVYERNAVGIVLIGGRDLRSSEGSNDNRTSFVSVGDAIWSNVGVDGGGILAVAGLRDGTATSGNDNNDVRLELLGTRFVTGAGPQNGDGANRRDVLIFAALGNGVDPLIAGTGNTVEILVRHATSDGAQGAFSFVDSDPPDPTQSNTVNVLGSAVALERANDGVGPITRSLGP